MNDLQNNISSILSNINVTYIQYYKKNYYLRYYDGMFYKLFCEDQNNVHATFFNSCSIHCTYEIITFLHIFNYF